jgi:hypothetical protein
VVVSPAPCRATYGAAHYLPAAAPRARGYASEMTGAPCGRPPRPCCTHWWGVFNRAAYCPPGHPWSRACTPRSRVCARTAAGSPRRPWTRRETTPPRALRLCQTGLLVVSSSPRPCYCHRTNTFFPVLVSVRASLRPVSACLPAAAARVKAVRAGPWARTGPLDLRYNATLTDRPA